MLIPMLAISEDGDIEMEDTKNREYYELVQKAKELVALHPSADQVIVVETEKSNIYHFANHLHVDGLCLEKSDDEEKFVQMLLDKGEPVLKYIVCMWNEYSIDVPSMNLRKLLMAASEKNADAMLVLKSVLGLNLKSLGVCVMPTRTMHVDTEKTRQYYDSIKPEDLCDCGYCINYYLQIKNEYKVLAEYLDALWGVDIEKPHETSPLVMQENGYIEYMVQYVVIGTKPKEYSNKIGDVTISLAEHYPSTNIEEKHFVLNLCPIRLKWDSQKEEA